MNALKVFILNKNFIFYSKIITLMKMILCAKVAKICIQNVNNATFLENVLIINLASKAYIDLIQIRSV